MRTSGNVDCKSSTYNLFCVILFFNDLTTYKGKRNILKINVSFLALTSTINQYSKHLICDTLSPDCRCNHIQSLKQYNHSGTSVSVLSENAKYHEVIIGR